MTPEDGAARSGRSSMAGISTSVRKTSPAIELDQIDRAIVTTLAADSRLSQRQLAREVGMSAPAVGERLSRLEKLGVVRGYTIEVDWSALGVPLLVYLPIVVSPGVELTEIVASVRSLPELDDLCFVTGSYDLIARMRLRDHAHLQEMLLDRIWPILGIHRVETFLSLGEVPGALSLAQRLGWEGER